MIRWLLTALVALLLVPSAGAHPMSRDKWSLRTALQLKGDQLDAVVVLEVPFAVVTKDLKADLEAARAEGTNAAEAQQAILDRYAKTHFDRMAKGLSITVGGKAPKGSWKPRDNRLNGKGAVTGGFFMYIVEFVPAEPLALDGDVTIVVKNEGYPEPEMVYSAMVVSGEPWTVAEDSSRALLPDKPYNLNDPAFWLEDTGLRTVSARFARDAK